MEEDEEENDFQTTKPKKTSLIFEKNVQNQYKRSTRPKRTLPLSLKSTRSKKKACSIKIFLEKNPSTSSNAKDQLNFCPICQLPFHLLIGVSAHGHVQECVNDYSESSALCPNGVNCNSVIPHHFKKYSHQKLASLRSLEISENVTNDKLESHLKNNFTDTAGTVDTNTSTPLCTNNPSLNPIMSTNSEETDPMFENIIDGQTSVDTQSSEKENLDEVNHWFNDGLEYDDLEMVSCQSECLPSQTDSTNVCKFLNPVEVHKSVTSETAKGGELNIESSAFSSMSSQCYGTNQTTTGGKELTKSQRKQMDIGVYFGLKPKQKVRNKTEDVTNHLLLQKSDVKEQTNAYCRDKTATPRLKKCPFYKIVEGTSFAVDAFSYGHIPGISAYFLSHFHYDHYGGLKKSFSKPIYCSQITANLVSLKIKVSSSFIHALPFNTPIFIENIEVILLEANHCPGAAMFIFKLPNGQSHLHTGDFRASTAMQEMPFLNHISIHTLYLDTTYCDASYNFPPQSETIDFCVSVATETVAKNAKTLIVVGTYTIGKEKIFTAVADALKCKVAVQRDKYNVLNCLESEYLKTIITQNYKEANVHVLPMAQLTHKKLSDHLATYSSQYSELLAFKPTGWTFTDSCANDLKELKPSKRASVTIYGVPYSEHSSFNELKEFVQFIKPLKIIPTVNNGSAKKREEMKSTFNMWLKK